MQKASWQTPMVTPAVARLPIRHAFGIGDGRTLFVVNDMARKSPAIITMTISNGVNIACPVIKRPTIKKSTGVISRLFGPHVGRKEGPKVPY